MFAHARSTLVGPVVMEVRALAGPAGGVVRYIRGLIHGLKSVRPDLPMLFIVDHPRGLRELSRMGVPPLSRAPGFVVPPGHAAFRLWWDLWALPAAVRRLRPQLLHRTKPAGTFRFSGLPPTVLTVYDVIPLDHPETQTLAQRVYWQLQLPFSVRTAAQILTISEASKRALVNRLGVDPERITVTYPGIDPIFQPATADAVAALCQTRHIPKPYLLTVGTIEPRKNVDKLLRAFGKVVSDIPHTLVLAGRWGWKNSAVHRALRDDRLKDRVLVFGTVASEDLPTLYSGADAFLCLSRAEGFGFPPLEAMACGTPVISSNLGSLPEVVGSAALLVNPDDELAVASLMRQLVHDRSLRERLQQAGIARSKEFTWRTTAEGTLAAYERALERGI